MASPPFANGQYNTMATHGNNSRLCATESASVSELEPEPESKANWGAVGRGTVIVAIIIICLSACHKVRPSSIVRVLARVSVCVCV